MLQLLPLNIFVTLSPLIFQYGKPEPPDAAIAVVGRWIRVKRRHVTILGYKNTAPRTIVNNFDCRMESLRVIIIIIFARFLRTVDDKIERSSYPISPSLPRTLAGNNHMVCVCHKQARIYASSEIGMYSHSAYGNGWTMSGWYRANGRLRIPFFFIY